MEVTVNLSGIKVHVGMYLQGNLHQVDENDVYVVNDAGECLYPIDNPDLIGEYRARLGWVSLTFLAQEEADRLTPAIARDAQRQAISDRHAG